MREMLFKNLTADDFKKRDILITEVVEGEGVIAKIERRCKYFVTNMTYFDKAVDYDELIRSKEIQDKHLNDKEYMVLRKKDNDSGEDTLVCKVIGSLFAVVGHYIFSVVYLHTIKVKLSTLSSKTNN